MEWEIDEYRGDGDLRAITELMAADLAEPYGTFTYRAFIEKWPALTIMARSGGKVIGAVVCQKERRKKTGAVRGYIAMLAVDDEHRKKGIGRTLVVEVIRRMCADAEEPVDEVCLETETHNKAALGFYGRLGFLKKKRMDKYYLSGGDAFQLVLPVNEEVRAAILNNSFF